MEGRILVIDGSVRMRDLFVAVLELDHRTMCVAADLDEARESACGVDIDVVLADAALASPAGGEPDNGSATELAAFADLVRTAWPGCDVVFLVDAARSDLKRRLELSRIRHFSRPFQIEELRDLVSGLLNRRKVTGK